MREVKNRLRKDYRDKLSEFTTNKNRVQQSHHQLLKHLSSLNFGGLHPLIAGYQALKGEALPGIFLSNTAGFLRLSRFKRRG